MHVSKQLLHRAVARTAAAMAFSLSAIAAQAAVISVDWTGSIVANRGGFTGVSIGQAISGAFSFDSDTPQLSSSGAYDTGHISSFTLGTRSGSVDQQQIFVFNDIFLGDQIDSRGSGTGGSYTGSDFDGAGVEQLFVRLVDSTGTVFSDVSLPTSLSPSDFDLTQPSRIDMTNGQSIDFTLTSFTTNAAVAPIPVAPSLPLLATGLALLGGWRLRHRTT